MFESAEIGHKIGKAAYREAVPLLRAALLESQVDLYAGKKIPVLVLIRRNHQCAVRVDGPALHGHAGVFRAHR